MNHGYEPRYELEGLSRTVDYRNVTFTVPDDTEIEELITVDMTCPDSGKQLQKEMAELLSLAEAWVRKCTRGSSYCANSHTSLHLVFLQMRRRTVALDF